MGKWTTFLYARPSFIEGVARLIDVGNTLQQYNTSLTSEQADTLALRSDWLAVRDDLKSAISQFELSNSEFAEQLNHEAQKALNGSL